MEKTITVIKTLKPGGFILIDNVPCRVEKIQTSSSGKHGATKTRVEAVGMLDGKRRSIVKPSSDSVDVPIVTKKKAQLLAITGNRAQIMDLTDYSVFELDIPEERRNEVKAGQEIDYFEVAGMKTLKKLK